MVLPAIPFDADRHSARARAPGCIVYRNRCLPQQLFTAAVRIGFIADVGIIVRNSIILVDFIELRRGQGMKPDEAVIDACAVRFRPMLLTAAAAVVGSSVIHSDPIFQGPALSRIVGEMASTFFSRPAAPLLCFLINRRTFAHRIGCG